MRLSSGNFSSSPDTVRVGDASLDCDTFRRVELLKSTSRGVTVALVVIYEEVIDSVAANLWSVAVVVSPTDARELPDALRLSRPAVFCLALVTSCIWRFKVRFELLGGGRTITKVCKTPCQ